MLIKYIIFIFFMLEISTAWFSFAKGQNRNLVHAEGLIIYPDQDALPQDIYFYPLGKDSVLTLSEVISSKLSDTSAIAYQVYFQGIHWIQPDVLDRLLELKYVKGQTSLWMFPDKSVRLTIGIIIFDNTMALDPNNPYNDQKTKMILSIGNSEYNIQLQEAPREIGVAKYLETRTFGEQ